MLSKWLPRVTGCFLLCLGVCATTSAQYGGGTSPGTGSAGTGSMSPGGYSSGSGKAIGIGVGVAAGAAVAIVLLVHHHHAAARSEDSVIGCTRSEQNGISLTNEKDNQSYRIVAGGAPLQPGDRVELKGIAADEGSGTHVFRVQSLVKNYGTCRPTSAVMRPSGGGENEMAQASK
jgi:hypothetical protein